MTTTLQVAETIRQQLGRQALTMIGARDLLGDNRSLQFKIGRNAKKVNAITIELADDDTYTLTFSRIQRRTWTVTTLAKVEGVYVDALHQTIETHTGMYTRL